MADLGEIIVDETNTVTKDYLNNDVFFLNNENLKTSTEQVPFREQGDKPDQTSKSGFTDKKASFFTKISNDSESDRQCLWSGVDKLYADNESNKKHFSNCIKSTVNTMSEHQSIILNAEEAGEDVNDYRQLENTEYNDTRNNRKWPLSYFDENDKIASIKWIDGSRFKLDDAKAECEDVLTEKQPVIIDKETGDKVVSILNDNMDKLNLLFDHMESDLEQQHTSTNIENSRFSFSEEIEARDGCFSFLEMQSQEDNKNNEREPIKYNYKDELENERSSNLLVSSEINIKNGISNSKETDGAISSYKQPENRKYSNIRNNIKCPLLYIGENDKKTRIKMNDDLCFESDHTKAETDDGSTAKKSGIYDKDDKVISVINYNLAKLNLDSSDIKGDLEQQTTSSNKENACFPYFETVEAQDDFFSSLVISTQETDKSGEKEVETKAISYNDETRNENNLVAFSEKNIKNTNSYRFQNQIFIKDKTSAEENKFALDSFIENHFINDRIQQENSIKNDSNRYNIQNRYSKITSIEDEKHKSKMDTKGEILPALNRFKYVSSNLKDEHAGDAEDMFWKESRRSYDKISLNLVNEKQLVEGECEKHFLYETKNSTSAGLITSDISFKKSESQAFQKENQENSGKFEQKKENFLEEVHASVIHSENILPEFENEHLECTNDLIANKTEFNHACVSSKNVSNEVIANKGEIYQANCCGKMGSSRAIDLFSSEISDEKTEYEIYKIEKTPDKKEENKGRILEKYHDKNIVKEGEINCKFHTEHTSEEQNNTNKQNVLKPPDLYSSSNNLSVIRDEQMLHKKGALVSCEVEERNRPYELRENNVPKNELNSLQKGFIDKTIPKLPELVTIKDDLFDKSPSKELNASQMYKDELKAPQINKDELNAAEKSFIKEFKPKTSTLKKLSCNLLGKIPPKLFLTAVGCDSEKTKCERSDNDCNNHHKYNSMIFGHCLDCMPIESYKTVKEIRATRILQDGTFIYDCDTGKRHRKKLRSEKQYNALKNRVKAENKEKRVTFAKDFGIFSYNPEKSVLEDFYNHPNGEEKEHGDEKEITETSEKVSEVMKGDIASENLKDTPTEVSETLPKLEEKSIKIGDTSAKLKVEPSEIKKTESKSKESSAQVKELLSYETAKINMKDTFLRAPGTFPKIEKKSAKTGDLSAEFKARYSKIKETDSTESLTEIVEPSYYDNTGFIDDWLPPCVSEIDLIDDPSATFEDDKVTLGEKTCLIDPKTKALPIKFLDLTRHTECKAKKWLKSVLSSKKKKP